MKRIILFYSLLISTFSVAQSFDSNKDLREKNMIYDKMFDSLRLKSSIKMQETERIKILGIDTFNKLLINDNYKKKEIQKAIVNEFNESQNVLGITEFYKTSDRILEVKDGFVSAMDLRIYSEKLKLIAEKLKLNATKVADEENKRILKFLRDSKFPIDVFNTLSNEERMKKIEEFEKNFVY